MLLPLAAYSDSTSYGFKLAWMPYAGIDTDAKSTLAHCLQWTVQILPMRSKYQLRYAVQLTDSYFVSNLLARVKGQILQNAEPEQ